MAFFLSGKPKLSTGKGFHSLSEKRKVAAARWHFYSQVLRLYLKLGRAASLGGKEAAQFLTQKLLQTLSCLILRVSEVACMGVQRVGQNLLFKDMCICAHCANCATVHTVKCALLLQHFAFHMEVHQHTKTCPGRTSFGALYFCHI